MSLALIFIRGCTPGPAVNILSADIWPNDPRVPGCFDKSDQIQSDLGGHSSIELFQKCFPKYLSYPLVSDKTALST